MKTTRMHATALVTRGEYDQAAHGLELEAERIEEALQFPDSSGLHGPYRVVVERLREVAESTRSLARAYGVVAARYKALGEERGER